MVDLRALRRWAPLAATLAVIGVGILLADSQPLAWSLGDELFRSRRGAALLRFWFGGFDPAAAPFHDGQSALAAAVYHVFGLLFGAPIGQHIAGWTLLAGVVWLLTRWDGRAGLLAAALALLDPALLGQAAFSINDMAFAFAWLAALVTLRGALQTPGQRPLIRHATSLGILLALDFDGTWMLPITAALLLSHGPRSARAPRLVLALALALAVQALAYPYLLLHAGAGHLQWIRAGLAATWDGTTLSAGQALSAAPPWWYTPGWLGVTLPLTTLVGLIMLGPFALTMALKKRRLDPVLSLGLLIPLTLLILGAKPLFDGARPLLFLVPLLSLAAARAWLWLHARLRWRSVAPIVALTLSLPAVVGAIRWHPLQATRLNPLAPAWGWARDPMGTSTREAVNWLGQNGTPPHNLCLLGTVRQVAGRRLPGWDIEDEFNIHDCGLQWHYIYIYDDGRHFRPALAWIERRGRHVAKVHRVSRDDITLGWVIEVQPGPGQGGPSPR